LYTRREKGEMKKTSFFFFHTPFFYEI